MGGEFQYVRIELLTDGIDVHQNGVRMTCWTSDVDTTCSGVLFTAATGGADADSIIGIVAVQALETPGGERAGRRATAWPLRAFDAAAVLGCDP